VEKRIAAFVAAAALAWGLAGCGTRRPAAAATGDAVIGAQRSAGRLQAIHDGLGGILQLHDSWIRGSIADAVAGIDRAFELPDEYDLFVQGVIARGRELYALISAGETEETEK